MSEVLLEDVSKTHVVSTPYLLITEKLLLYLPSYQNCAEGILYCLPALFEWNAKTEFFALFLLQKRFFKLIFGKSGWVG